MRLVLVAVAGLLFGTGISISGMINPAKVLNFFDVAGTFDPSLILVMAGGVATAFLGYRMIFASMPKPLFDFRFHLPIAKQVDPALVVGAATFGIGWGLSGFCPGGSIPALGLGEVKVYVFVASLVAGMTIAKFIRKSAFHAS